MLEGLICAALGHRYVVERVLKERGRLAARDAENIGECTMGRALLCRGTESLRRCTHRAGYWQKHLAIRRLTRR